MKDKFRARNRRMKSCWKSVTNCVNTNISDRNIRVVAITGGENVPRRSFRIDALAPFLTKTSVELTELYPTINKYPPASRLLRDLLAQEGIKVGRKPRTTQKHPKHRVYIRTCCVT